MQNKAMNRSVDSLQKIYAVIIAIAIGKVLSGISGNSYDGIIKTILDNLPQILSFFFIIIPFYHGMNRHLDECYIENFNKGTNGALLLDFFVFCIEAGLLFVFASFMNQGLDSFILLALLLIVDIIWAFISHLIHYKGKGVKSSLITWSIINSSTVAVGTLIYITKAFSDAHKPWILCVLILVRTLFDYYKGRSFYFPNNKEGSTP